MDILKNYTGDWKGDYTMWMTAYDTHDRTRGGSL